MLSIISSHDRLADASGGWLSSFMSNGKETAAREAAVKDAGIPFTIIRSGRISDEPGAQSGLKLESSPASSMPSSTISRSDTQTTPNLQRAQPCCDLAHIWCIPLPMHLDAPFQQKH